MTIKGIPSVEWFEKELSETHKKLKKEEFNFLKEMLEDK